MEICYATLDAVEGRNDMDVLGGGAGVSAL